MRKVLKGLDRLSPVEYRCSKCGSLLFFIFKEQQPIDLLDQYYEGCKTLDKVLLFEGRAYEFSKISKYKKMLPRLDNAIKNYNLPKEIFKDIFI